MSDYLALERLLSCQRAADRPQALRGDQRLSWEDWRRRVGQWRAVLAKHRGESWALYQSDAFEFSAILFALWASGKVACVPGSNQALIVASLSKRVAGFIGDFDLPPGEKTLTPPGADTVPDITALELDRHQLALEIFTSGSSGEPQAIGKQLYQLSEEVSNLEHLWGELADNALAVGTVSHHHIYGLLFRVLWPLAAGRCFDSRLCDYLEELNTRLAGWDHLLLISSPSHLTRIPEATDWDNLATRCRAIFSSGAPLSQAASVNAARLLRHVPIEVFGSSETGGIAYRQQAVDRNVPWQAVPRVEVAVDAATDCLKIRSPYLPPMAEGEWYLTSDKVLVTDGQFELQGRADRIVKIEGKRVSLTEMEKRLQDHPLVSNARVLVLSGKRTQIAAVVILSEAGLAQLEREGRRALNLEFNGHLLQQFERPVTPRRWRYPAELPVDKQGKVTQLNLAALFSDTQQERPLLPDIVHMQQEGSAATLRLHIPPELFYFQGHFPVAAILPGVVQIRWAEHYAKELLGLAGDFSHMEAVKFQHVVRPRQHIVLGLDYTPAEGKLSFRYYSDAGPHASGRIVYKSTS